MPNAQQTLDASFLEMRWRILSLAADMDRIQRSDGGQGIFAKDDRIRLLRDALQLAASSIPNRAEQLQLLFSDKTAPPSNPKSEIRNLK